MTATEQEVETVLAGALKLLAVKPDAALDDLAAAVVPVPAHIASPVPAGFPDLPGNVNLTQEVRYALRQLPGVFNSVNIGERRSLTQDEVDAITAEAEVMRVIAPVLAGRLEVIKEMIRVHMDVTAEQGGHVASSDLIDPVSGEVIVPATLRDQNGHYLQAAPRQPHQVQSGNKAWSQEYVSGGTSVSGSALIKLYEDGEITRREYLAVTRETRVLDNDKFRAFIRKAPARGLGILRQITARRDPSASLYLRNAK